jgi:hypothetical protein
MLWAADADIPWLDLPITSDSIAAGDSKDIPITFDSTGMDLGTYQGQLTHHQLSQPK